MDGVVRWGGRGEGERRKGRMPRPPPHLARRGHGLALAPRPPRRGLPARPLRPDAAAGGESTQSLTLSLGNGCRKVPAAAISPSSRGVPGVLLRPATAPGELWGRPRSARRPAAWPRRDSASPTRPTPQPRPAPPPERRPLTFGNPSRSPEPVDRQTADTRLRRAGAAKSAPPPPPSTAASPPSAQPIGRAQIGAEGLAAGPPHGLDAGPSPSSAGHPAAQRSQGAFNTRPAHRGGRAEGGRQGAHEPRGAAGRGRVSGCRCPRTPTHPGIRLRGEAPSHSWRPWGPPDQGQAGTAGRETAWASGHRLPDPQPTPSQALLTLALPAPGPMGFMMVYMFSLELVESETAHEGAGCQRGFPHQAHPSLCRIQAVLPPGLGMMGVPGGPPPPGGPCTQREAQTVRKAPMRHPTNLALRSQVSQLRPHSPSSCRGRRRSRGSEDRSSCEQSTRATTPPASNHPTPVPDTHRVATGAGPWAAHAGAPRRDSGGPGV